MAGLVSGGKRQIMYLNFDSWLRESAEDSEPVRIKLGPWVKNNAESFVSPEEFIKMFNSSVGAKRFDHKYYYIDRNPAGPESEGSLVQYSMKPFEGDVYVSDLQVEPRGVAAIKFLQKLTRMADTHKVVLSCISQPLDVTDKVDAKRLKNLYMRFGFLPAGVGRNSDRLKRMPN